MISPHVRFFMKKLVVLLALLGVGAGGYGFWYARAGGNHGPAFRTAPVERGNLVASISATGTIEPEEVVDIGAQVAGQIKGFGRDPENTSKSIDYGSPVKEGTVLATIDDAMYAAEVDQARADLGQARATVQKTEADLVALKAKFYQAERDWQRARKLGPNGAISQLDYDLAQNVFETSKAALPGGEAAVLQAKKAVEKAQATLKKAETNLGYCTIKAPVKGVIVDRRVNIGQTVVASLNAPSLFLIAKDLKRLQVWASVNEADIGHIHPGQQVRFTVDAYQDEIFQGEVGQIRLNASMTNNVVTYTVVVNTDNANGKLLPYLTANVQFLVSQRDGVLKVPNAALRWRPQVSQVAPDAREAFAKAQRRKAAPPGEQAPAPAPEKKEPHDRGVVWVEDGEFVRPVKVRTGLSDGVMTEVLGGDLDESFAVVIGETHHDNGEATTNPFTPQMFGGRKQ
jgi:HlyD family secretion protein